METYKANRHPRHPEMSPSTAFSVAVLGMIISIAFWSGLISVVGITKDSANHAVTAIQSWKESSHSDGAHRDLLITCGDGHMYTIRYMLYEGLADEFRTAMAVGAEASIYTGPVFRDVMEISINGNLLFSFETGYQALLNEKIGYAGIAAVLDLCGIALIIYGVKRREQNSKRKTR